MRHYFSTFSMIAETFVTAGVLYIVLNNYFQKGFATKFAIGLCSFEFSVNMMYMITRMPGRAAQESIAHTPSPSRLSWRRTAFSRYSAFILLVVYSYLAHAAMKHGRYFFYDNKRTTAVFLVLWMTSVLSGDALYFITYWQ
jgi:hypothetical protein